MLDLLPQGQYWRHMNGARMPALAVVALAFLAGCSLFMSDEAEEAAAIDKSLHKAALSAQQSNDYGLALRYFRQLYTANPSDLTAAEPVSSQPRYVDTSIKIERACEAPITNIG